MRVVPFAGRERACRSRRPGPRRPPGRTAARAPRGSPSPTAVGVHTAEVAPIVLRLLRHDPEGLLAPLLAPTVL